MVASAMTVYGTIASAQRLPDFYTLVDAGALQTQACPCITEPFVLPVYRPAQGYGEGAAVPLVAIALRDRQRHLAQQAEFDRLDVDHSSAPMFTASVQHRTRHCSEPARGVSLGETCGAPLPEGTMRARATSDATRAAALLSPQELAAEEHMVADMIIAAAKPTR